MSHMKTSREIARLDDRGRIVLPAGLRRELGLEPGDDLLVTREAAGVLRLVDRRAAAAALVGIAGVTSGSDSGVTELRRLRAADAAAEDRDAAAGAANTTRR